MGHPRKQKRPAVSLGLRLGDLRFLVVSEGPSNRFREARDVELNLRAQAAIEQFSDRHVVLDSELDLLRRQRAGELVNDQGVQLRVLRFLEPVVLEQAAEKRVQQWIAL